MERNKVLVSHYFLNDKTTDFQKQYIYYRSKYLPSTASYYSQYIYIYLLLNFLGKESTIESLYPTSSVGSQG